MPQVQRNVEQRPKPSLLPKNTISVQDAWTQNRGWEQYLPKSYILYIQLTRLNIAAPQALVCFPHFFGVILASITSANEQNPYDVLYACTLLLGGSFFYSNAAHAWDDLIDAPLDRRMNRTKNRPIARGAISFQAAFIFIVSQTLAAASFLLFLPSSVTVSVIPAIVMAIYYPWAKRHTYFPQVVLDLCLSWGVMTGSASLGNKTPWQDESTLCLLLACTLWTVIYDTIYAY